jgi:hypothetical protein
MQTISINQKGKLAFHTSADFQCHRQQRLPLANTRKELICMESTIRIGLNFEYSLNF